MGALRAVDQDLGPVRFCTECREWWPDDEEFWAHGHVSCLACDADRVQRRRRARAEASKRYRARLSGRIALQL